MLRVAREQIRWPAFSGLLYPADPSTLSEMIGQCFRHHTGPSIERPRILIVPHAGYLYSGKVAAAGYAQVRDCSKVILLGVSHQYRFENVVAFSGAFWQTPLGQVTVSRGTVNDLTNSSALFCVNNSIHKYEHSLEVQLPFLQTVLENFRIVPLLLGNQHAICEASAALTRLFDNHTLLVVSSDLSHYTNQANAERVDRRTREAILSGDPEHFRKVVTSQLRQGIPGLLTCACGAAAIETALRIAQLLRLSKPRLLAYQNSGDARHCTDQVVGYASIAFS